jgi:hypothetical protein
LHIPIHPCKYYPINAQAIKVSHNAPIKA